MEQGTGFVQQPAVGKAAPPAQTWLWEWSGRRLGSLLLSNAFPGEKGFAAVLPQPSQHVHVAHQCHFCTGVCFTSLLQEASC